MKKSSATTFSPSLEMREITKNLPAIISDRKQGVQQVQIPNPALQPTAEMVDYLNQLGHGYPFCAYQKGRVNDPL